MRGSIFTSYKLSDLHISSNVNIMSNGEDENYGDDDDEDGGGDVDNN